MPPFGARGFARAPSNPTEAGLARVAPIPWSTVRREMCFCVRNMFGSYKNYSANLAAGGGYKGKMVRETGPGGGAGVPRRGR
jgi:hypothetical protein